MPGIIIPGFGCLDFSGEYKPGDPPPDGYNEWHAWAEVQAQAGLEQAVCCFCSKWKFPQEMSDRVLVSHPFHVHTGKKVYVEQIDPVCLECYPKLPERYKTRTRKIPKPEEPDEQASEPVLDADPDERERRE